LDVGQVSSTIEVTAATALVSETSSSIGQVLDQRTVQDLPLVSNNVLDLMKTMAGVRGQGLGEGTTFAGITTGMVNTVRDGMSVQEGRYAAGVTSTTLINPDMVGEFRVILTPVDAEMGRGNGQVQITTKSGRMPCMAPLFGPCEIRRWTPIRGTTIVWSKRRLETDAADLDQSSPGDGERRRSDYSTTKRSS
jgi:hypothetical protein